jgi:hypothetical protein
LGGAPATPASSSTPSAPTAYTSSVPSVRLGLPPWPTSAMSSPPMGSPWTPTRSQRSPYVLPRALLRAYGASWGLPATTESYLRLQHHRGATYASLAVRRVCLGRRGRVGIQVTQGCSHHGASTPDAGLPQGLHGGQRRFGRWVWYHPPSGR